MKQKAKRSIALLLVLVMVFTFAAFLGACGTKHECGHVCEICGKCTSDCTDPACEEKCQGHEATEKHVCKHVCPTCGKCTDATCQDPVCADKCAGHGAAETHKYGHVCPTCGKCTDNTCTDPVCADKCEGHEPAETKDFTPIETPQAGTYYFAMKVDDNYWYITGQMAATYYFGTTKDKDSGVMVDLVADGDGWLIKQGTRYIEIAISGMHINAVYQVSRTAGKHWAWNATEKVFVWDNEYIIGNTGTYTNIGGIRLNQKNSNHFAVLGTFGEQKVEKPDPESVTLSKTGKVYLAPQAGNYIQLNATVQPTAAAQDIVWASSNEQAAPVENGKVTYVGAGETVISATAKDTAIKAEVTIVVTDKGSKQQPLSVDEAIMLMDTAGDGVTLGDANNKFYITGKVEEGSLFADNIWTVNLLGSGGKKVQCIFAHPNGAIPNLAQAASGNFDNYSLVLEVSLKKDGSSYTTTDAKLDSCERPAVISIIIDETAEVKMPLHAKLEVKEVLPVNAQLDGTEEWHSSDESKATVDSKGEITGVAAGSVEVWVSFGEVQSNKCNVTITAQESSSKVVYDWAGGFTADTVCDGTTLFIVTPSADKLMEETVNKWTPGQTEITALSIEGKVNTAWDISGFGFYPGKKAASGTLSFTTQHQIKKVTIKLIAYSTGTQVEFTVNGQKYHQDKIDDKWDGKVASAFDAEIELSEATNNITIESLNDKTSQFAIVGLTLEW